MSIIPIVIEKTGRGERLEDLETFNPGDYVAQMLASESQR